MVVAQSTRAGVIVPGLCQGQLTWSASTAVKGGTRY